MLASKEMKIERNYADIWDDETWRKKKVTNRHVSVSWVSSQASTDLFYVYGAFVYKLGNLTLFFLLQFLHKKFTFKKNIFGFEAIALNLSSLTV